MSAFSSHSSNPANGAARAVGNPAAQLSEGTACNTMQVAENLGERFVNFANVGRSVLDGDDGGVSQLSVVHAQPLSARE